MERKSQEFTDVESFKRCTEALGFVKNNEYKKAEFALESAINAYPEDSILHFYFGMVLAQTDQLERARDEFQLVADSTSSYAEGGKINVQRITEYLETGNVTINE